MPSRARCPPCRTHCACRWNRIIPRSFLQRLTASSTTQTFTNLSHRPRPRCSCDRETSLRVTFCSNFCERAAFVPDSLLVSSSSQTLALLSQVSAASAGCATLMIIMSLSSTTHETARVTDGLGSPCHIGLRHQCPYHNLSDCPPAVSWDSTSKRRCSHQ